MKLENKRRKLKMHSMYIPAHRETKKLWKHIGKKSSEFFYNVTINSNITLHLTPKTILT